MSNINDAIYTVDGFEFVSEKEAEQAQKEVEGVKYIKGKTDMKNPEMVLRIYNKMIEEGLFETAVGLSYLKEVQDYLYQVPFIRKEEILSIPVLHWDPLSIPQRKVEKEKKPQGTIESTEERKRLIVSVMLNLILIICIIAMFWISTTSSSPTILNYETKLIDRYASWEQELTEREQAVREKEQILGITPDTW